MATGARSRPTNCVAVLPSPPFPASTWISGPLITVPRPVTLPQPTCGRTIQKMAPSLASDASARCRRAFTSTDSRSLLICRPVTSPTCTPRYLTGVWPAFRPLPSRNWMVISAPYWRSRSSPSHAATAAAAIGTTHMSCSQARRRLVRAFGSASSPSMRRFLFLPDEPRVEHGGGKQRQHHHRGKGDESAARHHGRQLPQTHQRNQDREQKDVEHGPRPHYVDQPVQQRAAAPPARRAKLRRHHEKQESRQLEERHRHASDEDDGSDEPVAVGREALHASPDGALG